MRGGPMRATPSACSDPYGFSGSDHTRVLCDLLHTNGSEIRYSAFRAAALLS
jgi:hypothetical protein